MIQIGKKIVYREQVCTLLEIAKNYRNEQDYYVLQSNSDESLLIRVPVDTAKRSIRPLITKAELKALIKKIPSITPVEVTKHTKGSEYKVLLDSGGHENVIKVIKTTYLRQQEMIDQAHKPNESDKQYLRQAETRLYNEAAHTLDVSFEEAKQMIISKLNALVNLEASQVKTV